MAVFVAGSEEQLLKASAVRQRPSLGRHRPSAAAISTRWLLSEGLEALRLTAGLSAGAQTFGRTDAARLHTLICGSTIRLLPAGLSRSGLLRLLAGHMLGPCEERRRPRRLPAASVSCVHQRLRHEDLAGALLRVLAEAIKSFA